MLIEFILYTCRSVVCYNLNIDSLDLFVHEKISFLITLQNKIFIIENQIQLLFQFPYCLIFETVVDTFGRMAYV